MNKKNLVNILLVFLLWRVLLLVVVYIGTKLIPLGNNFLGGGLKNYLSNPLLWSAANFDGEHYLSIAQNGYKSLQYFYFPLFPLLVSIVNGSLLRLLVTGLTLNHLFFFFGLIGIWMLAKEEFGKKVAINSLFLLLLFPTSFYFVSFYTESLFFVLTVWSFYMARKKKWFWAGVLGGFSTATRIVGLALIPAFLAEGIKEKDKKSVLAVALVPLGILFYMYFLFQKTGDPLEFFNTISIFGDQRSSSLIFLPQVFYRYIFKVIPNLNFSYFTGTFSAILEFSVALLFLVLVIYSFFKLRLSYAIYLLGGYLIPTFSGSFSSLPRYVVILFPAFILLSVIISKWSKTFRNLFYLGGCVLLFVSVLMFTRGYWIS